MHVLARVAWRQRGHRRGTQDATAAARDAARHVNAISLKYRGPGGRPSTEWFATQQQLHKFLQRGAFYRVMWRM